MQSVRYKLILLVRGYVADTIEFNIHVPKGTRVQLKALNREARKLIKEVVAYRVVKSV